MPGHPQGTNDQLTRSAKRLRQVQSVLPLAQIMEFLNSAFRRVLRL
jgi:hypothetical protein